MISVHYLQGQNHKLFMSFCVTMRYFRMSSALFDEPLSKAGYHVVETYDP